MLQYYNYCVYFINYIKLFINFINLLFFSTNNDSFIVLILSK